MDPSSLRSDQPVEMKTLSTRMSRLVRFLIRSCFIPVRAADRDDGVKFKFCSSETMKFLAFFVSGYALLACFGGLVAFQCWEAFVKYLSTDPHTGHCLHSSTRTGQSFTR